MTHSLYCKSQGSTLKITSSVDSLLRHMRQKQTPRRLWIDAVCLNQFDNQEKSTQVQLMGQIYGQAHKVRIWLGEANSHTWKVFQFFKVLAVHEREGTELLKKLALDTSLHLFGEESLRPVEALLHLPWFQRRWVIQEVALSHTTTVHCGSHKIGWGWFVKALSVLSLIQHALPLDQTAQNSLAVTAAISEGGSDMLGNLWTFRSTLCTERQDYIFALYGLATDFGAVSSDAKFVEHLDYSSDWKRVYLQLATILINSGQFYQILSHVGRFGNLANIDNFPSWVPNWSTAASRRRDMPAWIGPPAEANPIVFANRHILEVPAAAVGTVALLCDRWPINADGPQLQAYHSTWISENVRKQFRQELDPYLDFLHIHEQDWGLGFSRPAGSDHFFFLICEALKIFGSPVIPYSYADRGYERTISPSTKWVTNEMLLLNKSCIFEDPEIDLRLEEEQSRLETNGYSSINDIGDGNNISLFLEAKAARPAFLSAIEKLMGKVTLFYAFRRTGNYRVRGLLWIGSTEVREGDVLYRPMTLKDYNDEELTLTENSFFETALILRPVETLARGKTSMNLYTFVGFALSCANHIGAYKTELIGIV